MHTLTIKYRGYNIEKKENELHYWWRGQCFLSEQAAINSIDRHIRHYKAIQELKEYLHKAA